MMYSDFKYIVKRVIIGVLICLIIMFLKDQVFAATCSNGTVLAQYTINNSSWTNFSNSASLTGNNKFYSVRIGFTNSNIKNNLLFLSGKFVLEANDLIITDPTFTFRYGTTSSYVDVTANCNLFVDRESSSNLPMFRSLGSTSWEVNFACSYQGSNSSANWLQIFVYMPNQSVNSFSYSNLCLQISPNSTDQIINNATSNLIEAQQSMYDYYSSLWDKSNAQEEVILGAISDLSDVIESVSSDIIDYSQDDSNTESVDGIDGFFDKDVEDDFGLISVIQAPVQFLRNINGVCEAKSFVIFSKTITIPCGDALLWNRDFSSYRSIFNSGVSGSQMNITLHSFRDFWNVLFGGAIIFHLLVKLFKVTQEALDPLADSVGGISDAIDTSSVSAVRDTDGDKDWYDPINDVRSNAKKLKDGDS